MPGFLAAKDLNASSKTEALDVEQAGRKARGHRTCRSFMVSLAGLIVCKSKFKCVWSVWTLGSVASVSVDVEWTLAYI